MREAAASAASPETFWSNAFIPQFAPALERAILETCPQVGDSNFTGVDDVLQRRVESMLVQYRVLVATDPSLAPKLAVLADAVADVRRRGRRNVITYVAIGLVMFASLGALIAWAFHK